MTPKKTKSTSVFRERTAKARRVLSFEETFGETIHLANHRPSSFGHPPIRPRTFQNLSPTSPRTASPKRYVSIICYKLLQLLFRDLVNFYVVFNGVQLTVSVDFAKDQPARIRPNDHPTPVILSSLKLHLIDKIPEFFSKTLQLLDVPITREWVLSSKLDRPDEIFTTAPAADLAGLKLLDDVKDVSNVKISSVHLHVQKVLGKGAKCKFTVLLTPQ